MSGTGYSQDELDDAQAQWSLRFPPDLVALLRERRQPVGQGSLDWTTSDPADIRNSLDWPFEGFWFDVQHRMWWPEWGVKPTTQEGQREALRAAFAAAPKLIPVYGHRYLPEEPFESGNPVFSVYQGDVIHYGSDLADWIKHETRNYSTPPGPLKEIPFWSDAVRRNGDPAYRPPLSREDLEKMGVRFGQPSQRRIVLQLPPVGETERPPGGGLSKSEPEAGGED